MTLFLHQWYAEWLKLLARKRTFIGFGVFLLLEAVLLTVFHLQGVERVFERLISRQGGSFDYYFSATTVGFLVLRLSVFLLGGLYLTLVAGDIVAKESEDGHLRLLLARPISRLRLLGVKYLTCTGYAVILVMFITVTALIMGMLIKGWGGGLFAWAPDVGVVGFFQEGEGLRRYFLGALLLGVAMTSVTSVAFFLSCLPIKPAAATISALSYLLTDTILREGNFLDSYPWASLTGYIVTWGYVFGESIAWVEILRSFTVLAAINGTLFIAGVLVFESRDLKS